MRRPPTGTSLLKTKVLAWLIMGVLAALMVTAAIGSPPPGKGQWRLPWRLLAMAHISFNLACIAHILLRINSWSEAQRADWLLIGVAWMAPLNNLMFFFLLPTFDVTTTCWPVLLVFNMLWSGCMLDLPPMHVLLHLTACLPVFFFLDFQKARTLARSSQPQQLLGSSLRDSCRIVGRYALHQGLPMLLLGASLAVVMCIFVQSSKREASQQEASAAPAARTPKCSQQADAAGSAYAAADVAEPDAAVPLESLGIRCFSALGLRPLLLAYHRRIVRLAERARHVVLGTLCLPVCSYYLVHATASRLQSAPFHISAEETMMLVLASYIVGRDSSQLDMSGIMQHVQSRLLASQTLLVDMLPAHLVNRMLNSMQGTHTQSSQHQQQQQQHRTQRPEDSTAARSGGRRAPVARATAPSLPGARSPQPLRQRPDRSASSLGLSGLQPAAPAQPGREAEAAAPAPAAGPGPGAGSGAEPEPASPGRRAPGLEEDTASAACSLSSQPDVSRPGSCRGPDLEGLVQERVAGDTFFNGEEPAAAGGGSPQVAQARPSTRSVRRPSFYDALSRNLSSSGLWSTLQSQVAAHAAGLTAWNRGPQHGTGAGAGTPQEQEEEQVQAGRTTWGGPWGAPAGAPGQVQVQVQGEVLSGRTTAASHECVTLFFSDICGFSSWAGRLRPEVVMSTLDELYSRLDDVILTEHPGLYKVETVGDAYIVAANLLTPDPDHAASAVRFALRAQQEARKVLRPDRDDGKTLEMRVGLHSGSIMSGIVGKIRRRFCLFGDTMNMAARTESSCPAGSIQLTAATHALAEPSLRGEVCLEERGEVQVKGADKPLMMFLASELQHTQQDSRSLHDDQGSEEPG